MYIDVAFLLTVKYIDYSLARYSAIYSIAKVLYFFPEIIVTPVCSIKRAYQRCNL